MAYAEIMAWPMAAWALGSIAVSAIVIFGAHGLGCIDKRDGTATDTGTPVLCYFNRGNLTDTDMRIFQGMTIDSFHNGRAVVRGNRTLADLSITVPEVRDNGIAYGNISLAMQGEQGGLSVGTGSYITIQRSEDDGIKADNDTIAAFDALSQLLYDVDDSRRTSLTSIVKLISNKKD